MNLKIPAVSPDWACLIVLGLYLGAGCWVQVRVRCLCLPSRQKKLAGRFLQPWTDHPCFHPPSIASLLHHACHPVNCVLCVVCCVLKKAGLQLPLYYVCCSLHVHHEASDLRCLTLQLAIPRGARITNYWHAQQLLAWGVVGG